MEIELQQPLTLNSTQAAKLLGISRKHLGRLVDRGEIPVLPLGVQRRFSREVLQEIARGERSTDSAE